MKTKLGIIFGGKSVEHEISIITGNQAINAVDEEKYEIVPIYISKKGLMYTGSELLDLNNYKDLNALISKVTQITLVNDGEKVNLVRFPAKNFKNNILNTIDVAIPTMHGTNGEDGAIQGYLEILGIPYAGCDILSSSVGMDKIMMRRVLKEAKIPSLDYVSFYSLDYIDQPEQTISEIENKINYPVIVKAGNLGSSVGIKKANDRTKLKEAIEYAMQFSDRIMVERAIEHLREINCSVIGDSVEAKASECEEPFGSDEILSYSDKYMPGKGNKTGKMGNKISRDSKEQGMAALDRKIPADITPERKKEIQDLAIQTFKTLGCSGVSRIDFMIDKDTDELYVNEINTIPGALSFYLWQATDLEFDKEIDKLVELAFKRQRQREERTYSYDENILAMSGSGKLGTKGSKQ